MNGNHLKSIDRLCCSCGVTGSHNCNAELIQLINGVYPNAIRVQPKKICNECRETVLKHSFSYNGFENYQKHLQMLKDNLHDNTNIVESMERKCCGCDKFGDWNCNAGLICMIKKVFGKAVLSEPKKICQNCCKKVFSYSENYHKFQINQKHLEVMANAHRNTSRDQLIKDGLNQVYRRLQTTTVPLRNRPVETELDIETEEILDVDDIKAEAAEAIKEFIRQIQEAQ